jgi:predicted nucleic acid-binding protein
VVAEFFHADAQTDRQTDRTNIIVAFRNFENAQKKSLSAWKQQLKDGKIGHLLSRYYSLALGCFLNQHRSNLSSQLNDNLTLRNVITMNTFFSPVQDEVIKINDTKLTPLNILLR